MTVTSVKICSPPKPLANTLANKFVWLIALMIMAFHLQGNCAAQGVRLTSPVLNGPGASNNIPTGSGFLKLRGTSNPQQRNQQPSLSDPRLKTAPTPAAPNIYANPGLNTPHNRPRGNAPMIQGNPGFGRQPALGPRIQNQQQQDARAPFVQPNAKVPRFSVPNPSVPGPGTQGRGEPGAPSIGLPSPAQQFMPPPASTSGGETIKERYDNGAVRIERQVIQDEDKNYINHGAWKFYLPNGKVAAQAYFENGKKSGAWSRWLTPKEVPLFKTAPLSQFQAPFLTTFHYVNDSLLGIWKLTDAANRTVFEINLKNGKRDGTCVWYVVNGQKSQEIQYQDGVLHGTFMKWNLRGKLTEKRQFEDGHEIGHITEFHRPNVKKIEYGVLAGKVESLTLDNPWNLEFATEKKIGPDIKHGPVSAWYPNGQVRFTGHFKNDVQDGNFVWYYETGQKQAEGSFANDQRQALWVWWHENGMRASVGKYAQGSPVGNWQWWMANGQLSRSQQFEAETQLSDSVTGPADKMKNASFRNGKQ